MHAQEWLAGGAAGVGGCGGRGRRRAAAAARVNGARAGHQAGRGTRRRRGGAGPRRGAAAREEAARAAGAAPPSGGRTADRRHRPVRSMLFILFFISPWCAVTATGASLELFHLESDNKTQNFRISVSASDSVLTTGAVAVTAQAARVLSTCAPHTVTHMHGVWGRLEQIGRGGSVQGCALQPRWEFSYLTSQN